MIPKIIHYCWFGGNPLPDDVKRYLATWRKYCPDYEIREWNEHNFDWQQNAYCREAYDAKKWAFVTDYVRLKVLYDYGGIYMDTDVEVLQSLDLLLQYSAFSGYESPDAIPTGTMGACAQNEWIGMLLHDYDNRHFRLSDGSFDTTTNVTAITNATVAAYHIQLNGGPTSFGDNMILLPFEALCAKSLETGQICATDQTYTVHHFKASWHTAHQRHVEWICRHARTLLGNHCGNIITKPLRWEVGLRLRLQQYGIKKTCLIYWKKIKGEK